MSPPVSVVAEPYDDFDHQRESAALGMWIFLAAEMIFFGGAILGFVGFRLAHTRDFDVASNHTKVVLGSLNTGVLLTSSLFMALAVHAAREGRRRRLVAMLVATMTLGVVFLVIKGTEYYLEYRERLVPGPGFRIAGADPRYAQMYFLSYFTMTGIHALHLLVGIGLLGFLTVRALKGGFTSENHGAVEVGGLYWHFVDIVWIFLFPLLYLLGRHVDHG